MTPDLLKFAIGSAASFTVVLVAAVVFLLRVSFKLGQTANEIQTVAKDMTTIKTSVEEIPIIRTRLGTVEEAWESLRSDFKELRRRVDGRSHPDYNGEE